MSKKIAILFPGQGSQYEGMGRDLIASPVYKRAKEILDDHTYSVVEEASLDQLSKTRYGQVAIFLNSLSLYQELKDRVLDPNDISVSASLGLSLGEYTALCAAGVFSLDEGIDLVKNRGLIMGQGAGGKGSMVAVMKTSLETIQDLVDQAKEDNVLAVCNLNSPGQIVVGGEFEALDRFEEKCKEAKIKRYMRLNVEGPFHTQILSQAAQEFADDHLAKIDYREPGMDVYTNLSGKNYKQVDSIVENLKDQMCSPVRFIDCVENMIADGCQVFIEIGPGKSLSGFVKKINKDVRVINIQNISDIEGIDLEDLK
ncbi:putative [acyl-carrier-protein] S-malonyltransferase [Peptostreptococcus stomatis DSM 17678]|uniref:Malonyl CoA-acyl carrier protein transacylase n=1 Tax=Peptostreptococcus stomatis DSM 17678 TaxID=596315 RepID=E0E2I2_9FIRM|nr:ACP S-malonyltransferase [Peptostreptococcus stomatis]EFM64907.1 putative [acyl-carrier-protein] S-malonyltransferase [Peptostreptococcus stomatis DSM 17678]MBL6465121.1 ACP S-malonyltransferase [Peptostreptococcus stomatis]